MRISDWSSDVCSSDLQDRRQYRRDPDEPTAARQMELTGKEAPRRRSASSVSASEPVRRKTHPKSCPTKSPDRCRRASTATASGSALRRSTPGRSSPPSLRLRRTPPAPPYLRIKPGRSREQKAAV